MSSCLCFICHNVININTIDEYRDKYRELIGMNLCLDSYLCKICCHILDKFWYFKSICLKRSYEYPVLFNERGTLNLRKRDTEIYTLCSEDICYKKSDNSICYVDKNNSSNHDFDNFDGHVDLSNVKNEYVDEFNVNNDYDDNIETTKWNNSDEMMMKKLKTNDRNDLECKSDSENEEYSDVNDLNEQNNENSSDDKDSIDELDNVDHDDDKNDSENDIRDVNKEKKPKRKSKKKKKEFERIILSLEDQKAELERNRKEKKYIEAEFKCYNCALGFLFKDTYQAHMMRHEESNGEYRCDVCTLRFASHAVLRSHAALHSERYLCLRCGRALRPRARGSHAALCYGRPGDEAACHMCARLFKDAGGLQQHLKRFHQSKTSTRTYPCSVCGKNYSNQAAVRTHMIKHIHRKFACELCSTTFSSPYTLTQHKKTHDAPSGVTDTHHCVPCDKSFKNRKSLLAHQRNAKHHQEQSFDCPICSRSCANQRTLDHHVESVHSTTKNYACGRCNARYSTSRALRRHMKGHDERRDVKLAVCHLCGRGFKGNNKLNRHLKEVCEKEKLEEQLSSYYAQDDV